MKKYIRKIAVFTVVALIFQTINSFIPQSSQKILAATSVVEPIKILEIEPGRSFDIGANTFGNINNRQISLTQMSMAQFIGSIEEINGKYDIVYIGNNTSSGSKYTAAGKAASAYVDDSGYSTEYYSENDITDKRSKDLLKFLKDSHQLTIFSSSIFNTNLSATKLYKNFVTYKNNDNMILVDSFGSSVATISSRYNAGQSKRPLLNITSTPFLYNGSEASFGDNRDLSFTFNINYTKVANSALIAKLYLDTNGDGLYNEDELKAKIDCTSLQNNYLKYRLPDNFGGIMPYKIVVTDTATNVDSISKGEVAFKTDNQSTPVVRVLQIYPGSGSNFQIGANLNNNAPLKVNGKYDIRVTEINIDDYNKGSDYVTGLVSQYDANGVKTQISKSVPTKLNGNYDMVILGFADSFNKKDITNQARIDELKSFIKTKQSVMFTHDTLTYHIAKTTDVSYNLTKNFRDYIGQSRYPDKFNTTGTNLDGSIIPHVNYPSSSTNTYGFTNSTLDKFKSGGDWLHYNNTYQMNSGIITDYPYKLSNGGIQVATTHNQWYQLNLEDENVIPWYTLDTGTDYKYDARNMYYTYSKGNITYSGTGHTSPNSSLDENQLFINTMIKAARSANHAPVITVNDLVEGGSVATTQKELSFRFTVDDLDNDITQAEIRVNDKLLRTVTGIKSGVSNSITLTKEELANAIGTNSTFQIKFDAYDHPDRPIEERAMAQQVVYNLNYVKAPVLNIKNTYNQGYLLGDNINISSDISVISSDPLVKDTIVKPTLTLDSYTGLTLKNNSSSAVLDDFVINGTSVSPDKQTKSFDFSVDSVGTYSVKNHVDYDYKGSQKSSSEANFRVKAASITVLALDKNGNTISKDMTINIKNENGDSKDVNVSGGNGTISDDSKLNLKSGSYSLSVKNMPNGYSLTGAKMTPYDYATDSQGTEVDFNMSSDTLNLSYNNGNPTLKLVFGDEKPVISISHTPSDYGAVPVTATLNFDLNNVGVSNRWYQVKYDDGTIADKVYVTDNQITINISKNCTIYAGSTNINGVEGTGTHDIKNIDDRNPTATIIYSTDNSPNYDPNTPTKGSVTATLVYGNQNTTYTVTKPEDGTNKHIFYNNDSFLFEFHNALGNLGSTQASVTKIDNTRPTGKLDGPRDPKTGYYNLTLHDVHDYGENNDYSSPDNKIKLDDGTVAEGAKFVLKTNSPFTVSIIDEAGNIGYVTFDPKERKER